MRRAPEMCLVVMFLRKIKGASPSFGTVEAIAPQKQEGYLCYRPGYRSASVKTAVSRIAVLQSVRCAYRAWTSCFSLPFSSIIAPPTSLRNQGFRFMAQVFARLIQMRGPTCRAPANCEEKKS